MHFKFLAKIYTLLYILYLFNALVYLFIEMQHMDPIRTFKYIESFYVKDILLSIFFFK